MPLAQASVRCPDGVFLDGAFDAYFAASLQVDEVLRARAPDIEWQSIDEVFVGLLAGVAPRAGIESRSSASSAPCARSGSTRRAAWRAPSWSRASRRSSARPRGVVHVLDGYEARFLSPLKIEMLPGIDPALARRLRARRHPAARQIAALTEPQLSLLAGRAGAALARHAAGIDASRIRRTAMPPARIEEQQLTAPTRRTRRVHPRGAARRGRSPGGRELRSRGVFARTFTLRLRFPDGRVDSRTRRCRTDGARRSAARRRRWTCCPASGPANGSSAPCASRARASWPASRRLAFPLHHR